MIYLPEIKNNNKLKISNILKKNLIDYVFPLNEIEQIFWNDNKNYFKKKNNVNVLTKKNSSIYRCADKINFYKYCKKKNIPSPFTSYNLDKFKDNEKIVIKENFGPSKGLHKITNKKKIRKKNIDKVFNTPIYQEYVSGIEYSADAWMYNNNTPKALILRKRSYVEDGEARITKLVNNKSLEKKIFNIFKKLKLTGHANLQFITKNKKLNVIECNNRFGGLSTFSINCGIDSFYWTFLSYFKSEKMIEKISFNKKKYSKQIRVLHDIYF